MKLNTQLMARLSSNNISTENFVKRLEEQKQKKAVPEHFANSTSNFRVRNLNAEEKKESPKLSQSFYFGKDETALQNSQLTRSTTIQNSQVTQMTSPSNNVVGKHRVLNQKQIQSIKLQNSLIVKRPSQPPIVNKSEMPQEGNPSLAPKPVLRKMIMKPPIQVPQIPRTIANVSQLTQRPPSASINNSMNNSVISQGGESLNNSIVERPPMSKIMVGRMRGSSLLNKAKPQEGPSPAPQMVRKATLSVSKGTTDLQVYETLNEQIVSDITKTQPFQFFEIYQVALRFNSQNDSLQLLGELLPQLVELRLNNSIIPSLRDLGTRLQGLRILWISRSQLKDISGINGLPNLQECYCCFNNINDLSPLAFHEKLEILDIEGNDIADPMQIDFLESLERLEELNLSSNPIMTTHANEVRQRLCRVINEIDDTDALSDQLVQEDDSQLNKLFELAWCIMDDVDELKRWEEKIKDDLNYDWIDEPDELNLIAQQIKSTQPKPKQSRPQTAMAKSNLEPPTQRYDPTSDLIQDDILCGNPLKAARQKNNKRSEFDPLDRKSMDIRNIIKQFQK